MYLLRLFIRYNLNHIIYTCIQCNIRLNCSVTLIGVNRFNTYINIMFVPSYVVHVHCTDYNTQIDIEISLHRSVLSVDALRIAYDFKCYTEFLRWHIFIDAWLILLMYVIHWLKTLNKKGYFITMVTQVCVSETSIWKPFLKVEATCMP